MNTKEVLKVVEKLANKFGTTAEELFEFYVKEAKLYPLYYWINVCVSVLMIIIGLIFSFKSYQPDIYIDEYNIFQLIGVIIGCSFILIGVISIIIRLFDIEYYFRSIKNPEYVAIEDLFSSIMSD